jgi:glutathione S-transferase
MIVLYGPAQAPYTEKVRRALLYKGVDFEFEQPRSEEDYKRWSPKTGQLPVLDLDGEQVPDSTAILYRLDEVFPHPPLLSSDPTVASQQRQLLDWADESFLWHYMRYHRLVENAVSLPTTETTRQVAPREEGFLRRFIAWFRAGGTWEQPHTGLLRDLGQRMDDLTRFLGSRPYFYAQQISIADLGVYAMLHVMRNDSIPGSAQLLAERPALVDFMQRVEDATERRYS